MAQNEPRCLDWVFTNNANVHVAKDRSWFSDYTSFQTEVGHHDGPQTIPVIGIGTVHLLTEPSPYTHGQNPPASLHLTEVLHAPSVVCNVIGAPILDDYDVSADFAGRVSKGCITDKVGRPIAYFDPSRNLLEVKPRDPPAGTYPLMQGGPYLIGARWSDDERERWETYEEQIQEHINIGTPLNAEEKQWMKDHFGDEFHFLQNYGMSIYKDEDREDGITLLRTLMQHDREQSGAGA